MKILAKRKFKFRIKMHEKILNLRATLESAYFFTLNIFVTPFLVFSFVNDNSIKDPINFEYFSIYLACVHVSSKMLFHRLILSYVLRSY